MSDTVQDELSRQFLAGFTAMAGGGGEAPYINANLYDAGRVRIEMRSNQMDMTREQFLAWARETVAELEKIGRET